MLQINSKKFITIYSREKKERWKIREDIILHPLVIGTRSKEKATIKK